MTARLAPFPVFQPLDNNGKIVPGFRLYTYQAGTTTPLATYSDASGLTPNSNPVIGDAEGRADVWIGNSFYKFELRDATDVVIWTKDNIGAGNSVVTNPAGVQTIEDFALNSVVGFNGPIGQDTPAAGDFTNCNVTGQFQKNGSQITFAELAGQASAGQIPGLTFDILFPIDGGGVVPSTGSKGYIGPFDFQCTFSGWTLLGDVSGSAVIDVKKGTYAAFPTTSSITGSGKPTLTTAQKAQSTDLSSWSFTTISPGEILEFNLDSISTITRLLLTIKATRLYS